MAINETVNGNDGIAISGTASAGDRTIGVRGHGDAVGIHGEGDRWHGVEGISHSTIGGHGVFGTATGGGAGVCGVGSTNFGVYGESGGTGVAGVSGAWVGVYGETKGSVNGPAGVWGEGKDGGDGVKGNTSAPGRAGVAGFHLTNKGPGIFGKGSPAGRFEGDVQVTGGLIVGDVIVAVRIAALEREIAALKTRIAALESRPGGSGGGVSSQSATVGVELRHTGGTFDELRIFGRGFGANEQVALTVESLGRFPDGRQSSGFNTAQTTADSQGAINQTISVGCPAGIQTTHTARARGLSSGRLSNDAGASC